MKKTNIIICLSLIAIMACSFATAQQQLKQVWLVGPDYTSSSASGTLWSSSSAIAFIDTAFNIRGIDVSTTEGKVIVINKAGGGVGQMYIANTLDGQTTGNGYLGSGSLDTTIINLSGATYTMDKVKVAADGAIYATNLSISSSGPIKVYRWASTTSVGTLAVSTLLNTPGGYTVPGSRFGDGMGIEGSGTNTKIYVSGSNSTCILKFSTSDGINFTLTSVITTSGIANGVGVGGNDITPVATGGNLWTSGPPNSQPTQLVTQAGVSIDSVPTSLISSSQPAARYVSAYGKKYILKATGNIGLVPGTGFLVDITSGGTTAFIVATTASFGGSVANTNGTGDATMDASNNFYFMVTNSGYGKFSLPLSVTPTPVYTRPGASGTVLAATGGTGIYTWTVSPGVGSLSTTAGLSVTYSPGTTSGTDTVTVTDSASSNAKAIIQITPTSTPLAPETDHSSVIRSEPVWRFME